MIQIDPQSAIVGDVIINYYQFQYVCFVRHTLMSKYQHFSTSDSHQMCYCYQKLEIHENFGSGSGVDLSKSIRGSESQNRSAPRRGLLGSTPKTPVTCLSQSEAPNREGSICFREQIWSRSILTF